MSADTDTLLQASALTRALSQSAGVYDISLSLGRGEILGLLGLNGAGKSTTLKILAGTLVADSGTVSIGGNSLQDNPLEARRSIGFLPDTPPLFNDMSVEPFLRFCAKLRKVTNDQVDSRIKSVMQQCDLVSVAKKRIAHLSKGYKQRVGLAQALVHEPAVLLLDEPSNGLDPQQMQGMRSVIEESAKDQAIIFSTHLLNEVQSVCNRVAVLHEGRLIHDAPLGTDDEELDKLFTGLSRQSLTTPAT